MNEYKMTGTINALELKPTKNGGEFAIFNLICTEPGYKGEVKTITAKMTAFSKTAEAVKMAGENATVTITGKIESREWQGRHYVDLRAMTVEGGEDAPF